MKSYSIVLINNYYRNETPSRHEKGQLLIKVRLSNMHGQLNYLLFVVSVVAFVIK